MPAFTNKHIEAEASSVIITLKPHDLDNRPAGRIVRGRIVNENGDPVSRAVIEVQGMGRGSSITFGALTSVLNRPDPLAVTNDHGEFRLGVGEAGDVLYLLIRAPYLASMRARAGAGPTVHTFTMGPGVTVSGRVVKNGRALPNVALGMVQHNRGPEVFLGDSQFATDQNGHFAFANMAPGEVFDLYGLMDSLRPFGAIPTRSIQTGAHGDRLEVGDLEVQPGHRVAGQIVLAHGKPLPPQTRVMVCRDDAWDTQAVTVDPEGQFVFTGIPAEHISLVANVRGYHLSKKNGSFDPINQGGLLGKVEADVGSLRLLFEPGPRDSIDYGNIRREDWDKWRRRKEDPLRGIPPDQ